MLDGLGVSSARPYRGPDRRALSAAALVRGVRAWRAAAAVAALVALILALTGPNLAAADLDDQVGLLAVPAAICLTIAGLLLLLRWVLLSEAPTALLGLGYLTLGVLSVPLGLLGRGLHAGDAGRAACPVTLALVTVVATVFWWRATTSPQVDAELRVPRLGLAALLAPTAGTVALLLGVRLSGHTHLAAPVSTVTQAVAAALVATTGVVLLTRPGQVAGLGAAPLGLAHLLAATGLALPPLGTGSPDLALLVGSALVLVAAAVVVTVAAADLRAVLTAERQRVFSLGVELAERTAGEQRQRERIHDVRSTVAGLRCATGTLQRFSGDLDGSTRTELEAMVVAELTRLERLLAGSVPTAAPVNLDDVLRPLVVGYRERGLRVAWQPSGVVVTTAGDDVAEIVDNLLGNVLRHAPGATATLTVEPDPAEGRVRVVVSDDGPGIDAATATRIFEPGYRGYTGPEADHGGEGLGLYVSRSLAARLGGGLRHEPVLAGSRFALDLPIEGA